MGNSLMIGVLVFGLLFGAFGGAKISNLNPFKSSGVTQKSEGSKEEYFNDKIKGIEYRLKEQTKNQQPSNAGNSIGMRIGRFIDNSIQLIIGFIIFGFVLLFFTGINVFRWVKNILTQLNAHRKALKQVVTGVQVAKQTMNGDKEKLQIALATEMDSDAKKLISDIKHAEGLK